MSSVYHSTAVGLLLVAAASGCHRTSLGEPRPAADEGSADGAGGDSESLPSVDAPLLLTPADNAALDYTTPLFGWSAVASSGAVRYELVLSGTPSCDGGAALITDSSTTTYQAAVGDALELGTTYYWCVQALDVGLGVRSPWSAPRRLALRPLRARARAAALAPPRPPLGAETVALGSDSELVLPAVDTALGPQVLDYLWRFEPRLERWRVAPALHPWPPAQSAPPRSAVFDASRGDAIVVTERLVAAELSTELVRFDPVTATWEALPLAAGSAALPTDCSSLSAARDAARDRILFFASSCAVDRVAVYELDRTQAPPLLAEILPTGSPAGTRGEGRAIGDASTSLILFNGLDATYRPQLSLYDPAAAGWTGLGEGPALRPTLVDRPAGVRLLALGEAPPFLFEIDVQGAAWTPLRFSGEPPGGEATAETGLALVGEEAAWFLVSGVSRRSAYVVEPDDRPTLTLRDAATGSADGTPADTVAVEVANDADAAAWLLDELGSMPAADDARWSTARPQSYAFAQASDGLRVLYLWLRYPHGTVGPKPAVASIWRLAAPPLAPSFTLYSLPTDGSAPSDQETPDGCVQALPSGSLDGVIGFRLSESPAAPIASEFDLAAFPVPMFCAALPAVRPVTVYGWLLDAAGNVSAAGSDTIAWSDRLPPSVAFDAATAWSYVSGAPATVGWTIDEHTPPVTSELRLSTASGCSGDVLVVSGIAGTSHTIDPSQVAPGRDYNLCVRATDSAVPPNTSPFITTQIHYQTTPARWHTLAAAPAAIGYATAVAYDSTRSRVLLFGGLYNADYRNGVHVYDSATNSWSGPLVTSGSPPVGRGGAAAMYEAATDRLVITAGFSNRGVQTYHTDTRALALDTLVWSAVPSAVVPTARGAFGALFDDAARTWIIGPGVWWTDDYMPYALDVATGAWRRLSSITGLGSGPGSILPRGRERLPTVLLGVSVYDFDFGTLASTRIGTLSGPSFPGQHGSAWDEASGLIVEYRGYSGSTTVSSRRTYVTDLVSSRRLLTDAANILDRGYFGMLRDPVRRSVLIIGGYVQHGGPWVETNTVYELRLHGGPRLFASDPVTGSELAVAGPSVDVRLDWDETATAWLVNESEWPAPAAADAAWSAARPASYVFPDALVGSRTLFAWIKDAAGNVVLDAGRRTIERTSP